MAEDSTRTCISGRCKPQIFGSVAVLSEDARYQEPERFVPKLVTAVCIVLIKGQPSFTIKHVKDVTIGYFST